MASTLSTSTGPDQQILATASDATTTWTACANEGGYCSFTGTQQVRYGTSSKYNTLTLTGGTSCTNAVFGDPAYGIGKSCMIAAVQATTPDNTTWTLCAAEGQTCTFTGTQKIRYGTTTANVTGTYTNSVSCTNNIFGDPAWGIGKSCWVAVVVTAAAPVATPGVGAAGTNPPIVFNATGSGRAGNIVSLQGENFGSAPKVYFEGAPGTALPIVNQVGTGWVAVQLPATAPAALLLRIDNGTGTSARIALNAARALHLDAMQLAPGGAFRVFGRNLMLAGSTPTIKVAGVAATIDTARSDEYVLTALAPASLPASAAASIVVDNGTGAGAATLDRTIQTVSTNGTDPFGLGVGWAAGFAAIANNTLDVATDPRISTHTTCNGTADDGNAIQGAINYLAANGGGVVRLPAGQCRLVNRMSLASRVVVQGAGMGSTRLVYDANYPFIGGNIDLAGVRNLTLVNSGAATEGPLLKDSTRVFLQNVTVQLNSSRQMYLSGNSNIAVKGSTFVQTNGISEQGPYTFSNSSGLVFEGNTTQWINGAPDFGQVHDASIQGNRFTRDARGQGQGGVVHSLVLGFAHRVAVIGNTFDVANGPITNKSRNDGETILTEGGGASRTENLGTATSAGATTLTDTSNVIKVDPFGTGAIPENYGVAIVGGKGAGQMRRVTGYAQSTLTVDRAWDVVPDASSKYATYVYGLEKALIKDNVLSQNPRGIWLYHTAIRDVDVVGNTMTEGGGIYLRAYQNLSTRSFMPIYNVLIARNTVVNTTGNWMSYVNSVFVNSDARAFGIAMLGVETRGNSVTANRPNVYSGTEEYASTEGYASFMRVENYGGYETSAMPRVLGAILADNTCTYCDIAMRIGTGDGGTTVVNTKLVGTAVNVNDAPTTSTSEKSVGTVLR